jgi:hypothetical protein
MRETFHWNSEISLSYDVLTRGGHTNRKERNKTHKKSSSSLSLPFAFLPLFFCLLLSCSGRQREGEINVKTKARISNRHRAPGRISYPLSEDKQLYTTEYNWKERRSFPVVIVLCQNHNERKNLFLKLHFSLEFFLYYRDVYVVEQLSHKLLSFVYIRKVD